MSFDDFRRPHTTSEHSSSERPGVFSWWVEISELPRLGWLLPAGRLDTDSSDVDSTVAKAIESEVKSIHPKT